MCSVIKMRMSSKKAFSVVLVLQLTSLCMSQSIIVLTDSSPNITTTLFQYLQNNEGNFTSDTTVMFQPGHHQLNMTMTISNVENLTLSGVEQNNTFVNCSRNVGLSFENISNLTISRITFVGCGGSISLMTAVNRYPSTFLDLNISVSVGVFFNYITDLDIDSIRVFNGSGYGVFAINVLGDSTVSNSVFAYNNYDALGSIPWPADDDDDGMNCQKLNLTDKGGNVAILYTDYETCLNNTNEELHTFIIRSSQFEFGVDLGSTYYPLYGQENGLPFGGGGLGIIETQSMYGVDITIQNTTITRNTACIGSNLYLSVYDFVDNSIISISDDSEISYGNYAASMLEYPIGTALCYVYGQLPLKESVDPLCHHSSEGYHQEILQISDTKIQHNLAPQGHIVSIHIWPQHVPFHGDLELQNTIISNNHGQNIVYISNPSYSQNIVFYISNPSYSVVNPIRIFFSKVTLSNNSGVHDDIKRQITLQLNFIKYLNLSECSFSYNVGSAIRARQSQIYFRGNNTFSNNSGYNGGALHLQEGSHMYLEENCSVTLVNNYALELGGAIFASSEVDSKCFFQPMLATPYAKLTQMINFDNNMASLAGSEVYGNIEHCSLEFASRFTSVDTLFNISNFINNNSQSSLISSSNFRLCPCNSTTHVVEACENAITDHTMAPGQTLSLPVVPQAFHYDNNGNNIGNGISPAIVFASFDDSTRNVSFDPLQIVQVLHVERGSECTRLDYTIYTDSLLPINLKLIATYSLTDVTTLININFAECPVGFEHSTSPPFGCVCNSLLQQQIGSDLNITCDVDSQTISRVGLFSHWIGIKREELAIGKCSTYCNRDKLYVNLNQSDEQCTDHHTGVLCGGCGDGYSLALGTVNCLECSNWYLLLLLFFLAAGIFLVLILTVFNLTVSTGKLNALLYYANIIKVANRDLFRYQGPYFLPFSIFINWLNLDFGIETCFYDGLDAYTKAWLQYLFPLYLFVLMGIIIFAAKHSTKIANILPRNTISVLATLLLMTFTKILFAAIEPFPFRMVHTANGTQTVWESDGNIEYFGALHGPLMTFSLLILLFFHSPYVIIILLHPLIDRVQLKKKYSWYGRIFNFLRGCLLKIRPLFDSYEAPYREKTRGWTGLLLIVRFITCVISILAISYDWPSEKAIVVVMINIILLGLIAFFKIYNRTPIRLIETSFIVNLVLLEGALLIVELSLDKTDATLPTKATVAGVLIGIAVLVFAGITLRELYKRYASKLPKVQAKGMAVETWIQQQWRMRKTTKECACDDVIDRSNSEDYHQAQRRPIVKSQLSTCSTVTISNNNAIANYTAESSYNAKSDYTAESSNTVESN